MKSVFGKTLVMVLWLCISTVTSLSTNAQESDEFMLEEITVTAQKRKENQQKVPITMDVIAGEDIKKLGQNDLSEVLVNVAGALVYKVSNELRVSIRGVSNDQADFGGMQASTPTVAVNKDGIYTARKSSGQNLFDIERVEVLYGPQSTMYATNSPGGIVNVITADPKLEKFEGSGSIEIGNYDLLHTEGVINAPISDSMALRGAFSSSVHSGYLSNGGDNDDTKSVRLKTLYNPNDTFYLVIAGETSQSDVYGMSGVYLFDKESDADDPWTATDSDKGTPSDDKEYKLYSNINWNLGFGDLAILPSHYERTNYAEYTETIFGVVNYIRDIDSDEDGVEIRLSSQDGAPFKWGLGLNWYKAHEFSLAEGDDGSVNNVDIKQETEAVYGNITYPLKDNFRVTAGLRYSTDAADAINVQSTRGTETYNVEYTKPNYKIGVEYDINDTSMIYSDYATSYRLQGAAFSARKQTYPTEQLKAISIGAKNRFFDNRLQINSSAYFYKYKNYLAIDMVDYLDQIDINGDGDFDDEDLYYEDGDTTRNETIVGHDTTSKQPGDLNMWGVDVQASYVITGNDRLDASISHLNTEFTHLFFDYLDETNATGFPDMDYSGCEKTYSPNWTAKASYSHNFNLNNGSLITARIEESYQSEYLLTYRSQTMNIGDDFVPRIISIDGSRTQEAYHLTNLSLVYNDASEKWKLTGYVKNLEDYAVKRSWTGQISEGGGGELIIDAPRTYGLIFSVTY